MINQIKEQAIEKALDYLADGETLEDAVSLAMYYIRWQADIDLWAIMREYQSPEYANIDDAIQCLYADIYNTIINKPRLVGYVKLGDK